MALINEHSVGRYGSSGTSMSEHSGLRYSPMPLIGRNAGVSFPPLDKTGQPGGPSAHQKATRTVRVRPMTGGGTSNIEEGDFLFTVNSVNGDTRPPLLDREVDAVNQFQLEQILERSHEIELQTQYSNNRAAAIYDPRVVSAGHPGSKRGADGFIKSPQRQSHLHMGTAAEVANKYSFAGVVVADDHALLPSVNERNASGAWDSRPRDVSLAVAGKIRLKNIWGRGIEPGAKIGFMLAREKQMTENQPVTGFDSLGPYRLIPVLEPERKTHPHVFSGEEGLAKFRHAMEYTRQNDASIAAGKKREGIMYQPIPDDLYDYTSATIGTPFSGPCSFVMSQEEAAQHGRNYRDAGQFNLRIAVHVNSNGETNFVLVKQFELNPYFHVGVVLERVGTAGDPSLNQRVSSVGTGLTGYHQSADGYIEVLVGNV